MPTASLTSWICGLVAYILWGLLPLYWRLLSEEPPSTILAHRVVWSAACLIAVIICTRQLSQIFRTKNELLRYGSCAIALTVNWGLYIWAVSNHLLLASSLGYFLAPLFYTLAGLIIWKEPISIFKIIALGLGTIGLIPLLWSSDLKTFFIASGLALSIVIYGSLRKGGKLPQIQALALESIILAPVALIYLLELAPSSIGTSTNSTELNLLLFGSGPVTLIPLLFFGRAVKELPLNQIGFLQYIAPSLQFIIAVLAFGEIVDPYRLCSFTLVWLGILLVCFGALKNRHDNQ